MNRILLRLRQSVRTTAVTTKDRGASAVEYGLMVAAIAAVIVGTVFALGGFVKSGFDNTCAALKSNAAPGCSSTTTTTN